MSWNSNAVAMHSRWRQLINRSLHCPIAYFPGFGDSEGTPSEAGDWSSHPFPIILFILSFFPFCNSERLQRYISKVGRFFFLVLLIVMENMKYVIPYSKTLSWDTN